MGLKLAEVTSQPMEMTSKGNLLYSWSGFFSVLCMLVYKFADVKMRLVEWDLKSPISNLNEFCTAEQ